MNIQNLLDQYPDRIANFRGDANFEISSVKSIEEAASDSLIYILNEKYLTQAKSSKAKTWLIDQKLWDHDFGDRNIIASQEAEVLLAKILQDHFDYKNDQDIDTKNTCIDPSAKIADNVFIGSNTVIEENVVIEKNVSIGANCYISKNTTIKADAKIGPFNYIGANAVISNHCKMHSHNVIASPAFTDNKLENIGSPSVILHKNVELGSSNTIESGVNKTSEVGEGSKIDNQVLISYDTKIGAHSFLTANVRICHNVTTGHHFVIGGASVVEPNIQITDAVQIAAISCVDRDINEKGSYGGHPLQSMRDYLKTSMILAKLSGMRKQIMNLLKT